jgi:cis-L-3-hydroxyproline dehydratase
MTTIPGRLLVRRDRLPHTNNNTPPVAPLLVTDVPLSFWGGIDPLTGVVVDATHPLHGHSVQGTLWALPSGRGSSTASQVLLELVLNDKAPRAILLRDLDGLVTVGALIAQEILHHTLTMDIVHVGEVGFAQLLAQYPPSLYLSESHSKEQQSTQQQSTHALKGVGAVTLDGSILLADNDNLPPLWSLSEQEQDWLDHAENDAQRMAYHVLFHYAHLTLPSSSPSDTSADSNTTPANDDKTPSPPTTEYRTVTRAHMDGCTYIGPGGLAFAQRLVEAGGSVVVPTTLNSMSTDRLQWSTLLVPPYPTTSSSSSETTTNGTRNNNNYNNKHAIDASVSSTDTPHTLTTEAITAIATRHQHALALGQAYVDLGCQPSFTCAPYLLDHPPALGQDVCWGESNAVVYANSVLGARTEKYADYLDICCALVGRVPAVGMHVTEQRQPRRLLDVTPLLQSAVRQQRQHKEQFSTKDIASCIEWDIFFPVLGHVCGTLSDGRVPLVIGLEPYAPYITRDYLKAFCAAYGTTGTSPLIHVAGITAEARDPAVVQAMQQAIPAHDCRVITSEDWECTFQTLDAASSMTSNDDDDNDRVDLIALGNPHLSLTECQTLVNLLHTSNTTTTSPTNDALPKKNPEVRIMACMSRDLYQTAQHQGLIQPLQAFGMEFINDTCWCMLLDPPVIPINTAARILTNSGKYAHYGPGLTGRSFRLGSTRDCMQAAISGRYPRQAASSVPLLPRWMSRSSLHTSSHSWRTPSRTLFTAAKTAFTMFK